MATYYDKQHNFNDLPPLEVPGRFKKVLDYLAAELSTAPRDVLLSTDAGIAARGNSLDDLLAEMAEHDGLRPDSLSASVVQEGGVTAGLGGSVPGWSITLHLVSDDIPVARRIAKRAEELATESL